MQQRELTNWVLREVHQLTPSKYSKDPNLQRLYHAGFLASYLANLFKRDPYLLKEFQRHCEKQQKPKL